MFINYFTLFTVDDKIFIRITKVICSRQLKKYFGFTSGYYYLYLFHHCIKSIYSVYKKLLNSDVLNLDMNRDFM